jgi:hypothetical protein
VFEVAYVFQELAPVDPKSKRTTCHLLGIPNLMAKKASRKAVSPLSDLKSGQPPPSRGRTAPPSQIWRSGLVVLAVFVVVGAATSPLWKTDRLTKTEDGPVKRIAVQPPHPIRQGHSETQQSIQENHVLLNRYRGELFPFELLDTFPHNKSLFT